MQTRIVLVRHAQSDVYLGSERERGLTKQGEADVAALTAKLRQLEIDAVVSSPYARAILTVQGLADERGLPVRLEEGFRERRLHGGEEPLPREAFEAAIVRSFADIDDALPGGESFREAQARGLRALRELLRDYRGQAVAVGTHGNLMTTILRAYDDRCGYSFWRNLAMPDAYRMIFDEDERLLGVERLWN